MKIFFYRAITAVSKILGLWFFNLMSKGVAAGYFLLNRRRREIGIRFYAAKFPNRSRNHHILCTWKQFQNFTQVFLDRFLQTEIADMRYTIDGRSYVTSLLDRNEGGILLMSHMGNWEVAAHLLRKALPNLRLMLYLGARQRQEIEKLQKQSVRKDGVHIVCVDEDGGSALDIVEAVRFLRDGGFVSMTGDRIWREDQKTVSGNFLGHSVRLPEAPFVLAALAEVPLIAFFGFKVADFQYEFSILPPIRISKAGRGERAHAVHRAAQCYLSYLETALDRHPFEWYHFESFIGKELK
jgi:predicted LPLAT superfamily acyltransferase